MPTLVKEFELHADVEIELLGVGPFGTRILSNITGGQFVGDRLKGEIVGASGDWALIGIDGFLRPDVRLTFRTIDGALIYVQFFGVAKLIPEISDIIGSGSDTPTSLGVEYLFVHPRMETSHHRYLWVNQTMFIGEGRALPGSRAEYKVYRVAKS